MTQPELLLIERRPRLCRLASDEVQSLLAHGPGVLQLAPTARRSIWRVTPGGVVGVLFTSKRRIIISPKIPLCNILFLLDPLALPPQALASDPTPAGEAVVRLLVNRLVLLLRERASAGLHRGYRERTYQGSVLRGRLDVAAQLRQPAGRRDQLHSQFDEFTADIPCNQMPRAVAGALFRSPALDTLTRAGLGQALTAFAEVSNVAVDGDFLARLDRDREPEEYGPLLDLCRVLMDSPGGTAESTPGLLVTLERLFERYVSRAVEEALAGRVDWTVHCQATYPFEETLQLRPDVTIEAHGRPVVVMDAKWKRLPEVGHIPEDVYQALAYAAFLEARQAVLVYPGPRRPERTFTPAGMQGKITIQTLNVSGALERCRRSRARFQRDIRRVN